MLSRQLACCDGVYICCCPSTSHNNPPSEASLCVLTEEESSPCACSRTARLLLDHAGLLRGPASALTGRCDVVNGFDASTGALDSIMARSSVWMKS